MRVSGLIVRKFGSVAQERAFLVDYARRFAYQRRLATIATVAFPAFVVLDWWVLHGLAPAIFRSVVAVRIAGTVGMSTAIWLIWGKRIYDERQAVRILWCGCLSVWFAMLGMMVIAPAHLGFSLHFPGLLVAFFTIFTLFRLRAIVALGMGGLCVVSFEFAELWIYMGARSDPKVIAYDWITGSIFLCLQYLIGIIVCTQFELAARREFVFRRSLRAAKARVETASFAIKQQNERMKKMVEEKERFFSSAYHDIQQPLAAINLFIRSARIKLEGGQGAGHDLDVIEKTARDVLDMFKGIQDYSELGSYTPHLSSVPTQAVLAEVCEQYFELARSRDIELRIGVRSRLAPPIRTDRSLFKRALSNLVSNAIKNTSAGGVVVGWVELGERLRIDVWDTGLGIPAEQRDAIFAEYYQINNPGRDRSEGLGLGLSIVRRVVTILPGHGMRLGSVEGRGSRFSLYAPISKIAPAIAVERAGIGAHTSMLSGCYLLLCDDEPIVLEGLRRLFVSAGALVDAAGSMSGIETMLTEDGRAPDVIVTDIRLRDGSTGIEVAERIRRHFAWAGVIPVAFITGELMSLHALRDFSEPFVLLRKSSAPESTLSEVSRLVAARPWTGVRRVPGP